jgi:hypothetical protein
METTKEIATATVNGITQEWFVTTTKYKNGKIKSIRCHPYIDIIATSPTDKFGYSPIKVINT